MTDSFESAFYRLANANNSPPLQNNANPHTEIRLANNRLFYMFGITESGDISAIYANSQSVECQIPTDIPSINQFMEYYVRPMLRSPTIAIIDAIVFVYGAWYQVENLRIIIGQQEITISWN